MSNEQEYYAAMVSKADRWVSACGGLEVPFMQNGYRMLRVYNFAIRKHGYLNLDTDIVEIDE